MAAKSTDLVVTLTGGSSNSNPNLSIGGDPSSYPVTGQLNNLFDNVAREEASVGSTSYRCIYIFNNNSVDTIYNLQLYTLNIANTISTIELGIRSEKEIQDVIITGVISNGYFTISYKPLGKTEIEYRNVNFDLNPVIWTENLQTALRSIESLENVTVNFNLGINNIQFKINFDGLDDKRSHDLFNIDKTNLIGAITASVTKSSIGSPINSIPTLLDVDTTIPYNVNFFETSNLTTISIGNLYPEEGFPLWIKRTVPPSSESVAGEGFKLKILGSPNPSTT
jgi:hypothetical protein